MTGLDRACQEEEALVNQLDQNPEYVAWEARSTALERNRVTKAVNRNDIEYRKKLEPGAAAFFDYLVAAADAYEKYDGVRPLWELEELDW